MTELATRTDEQLDLPALPGQPAWLSTASAPQIPQQPTRGAELPVQIRREAGHRRGVSRMRALAQRLAR